VAPDAKKETAESIMRGRVLFEGKARCVGCHSGSTYSDERLHVTGIPSAEVYTPVKTPTLRGLPSSAPYFRTGVASTLEDVVEFYNSGSLKGVQNPFDAPIRMPARIDGDMVPLGLTTSEKNDLVSFLTALGGTTQQERLIAARRRRRSPCAARRTPGHHHATPRPRHRDLEEEVSAHLA
jgi:cytochrome c peroxidase